MNTVVGLLFAAVLTICATPALAETGTIAHIYYWPNTGGGSSCKWVVMAPSGNWYGVPIPYTATNGASVYADYEQILQDMALAELRDATITIGATNAAACGGGTVNYFDLDTSQ